MIPRKQQGSNPVIITEQIDVSGFVAFEDGLKKLDRVISDSVENQTLTFICSSFSSFLFSTITGMNISIFSASIGVGPRLFILTICFIGDGFALPVNDITSGWEILR